MATEQSIVRRRLNGLNASLNVDVHLSKKKIMPVSRKFPFLKQVFAVVAVVVQLC